MPSESDSEVKAEKVRTEHFVRLERDEDQPRWVVAKSVKHPESEESKSKERLALADHSTGNPRDIFLAAPFVFVDRKIYAEDLGIEINKRRRKSLVRLRFTHRDVLSPYYCEAYFDASTYLLDMIFLPSSDGHFQLITYDQWERLAGSNIIVPKSRALFYLKGQYDHVDFTKPDCEEKLVHVSFDGDTKSSSE